MNKVYKAINALEKRTEQEMRVSLAKTSLVNNRTVVEHVCSVCGSVLDSQYECKNCGAMDIVSYANSAKYRYVFGEKDKKKTDVYNPMFFYAERDEKGNAHFAVVCALYERSHYLMLNRLQWFRKIGVICSGTISKNGTLKLQVNDGIKKNATRLLENEIPPYSLDANNHCIVSEPYTSIDKYRLSGVFPINQETEDNETINTHLVKAQKSHGMFKAFIRYMVNIGQRNMECTGEFAGAGVVLLNDCDALIREFAPKVINRYENSIARSDSMETLSEEELLRYMKEYPPLPEEKVKSEINPGPYALRKVVTDSANQIEHHIFCSCGKKTVFSAKINGSDKESWDKNYKKAVTQSMRMWLSCPDCGRNQKLQRRTLVNDSDVTKPASKVHLKYQHEEEEVGAVILYAEKATRLPGDAILLRYYDFDASIEDDAIRTSRTETIRCFLMENKHYLFALDPEDDKWVLLNKLNNPQVDAQNVLRLEHAFSMQENLEKVLKGTILDRCGYAAAVKKGFPSSNPKNMEILQISGGLQAMLTAIKYPGIADLYQKGFTRTACMLTRASEQQQSRLLKRSGKTAAEMFSTKEEILTEIKKLDEEESLDAEDLKEIVKASQNNLEDIPLAYWAAANCAIKEISSVARACGTTFKVAASKVAEIAEMELESVNTVAKNLLEHVKVMNSCDIAPELPVVEKYDRDRKFLFVLNWLRTRMNQDFSIKRENGDRQELNAEVLYKNRDKKFVRDALIFATGIVDSTKSPAVQYVGKRLPALRYAKIELTCMTDENDTSLLKSVHVKIQDEEKKTEKTFSEVTG